MYIYNLHSFKNVEIKPCPHLDWPSGPCYHWLTKDQMLWVTIRLKHRCFEIAFVLLHHFEMSGSEREFHLPYLGIAYETYNNDTSETRALISEEIDRKRSVVLISCKWYLCSNIRLLARAKEPLEIGGLNVRTLKAEYKQSELTYVSGKIRIDILGLDCARHDEEFKFSPLRQYKLIT